MARIELLAAGATNLERGGSAIDTKMVLMRMMRMRMRMRMVVMVMVMSDVGGGVHAWGWLMVGNWSATNFVLPCNSSYNCINLPRSLIQESLTTYRCQGVSSLNEQWEYDNSTGEFSMDVSPPSGRRCLDVIPGNDNTLNFNFCNGSASQEWRFEQTKSKIRNGHGQYLRVLKWALTSDHLFDMRISVNLEASLDVQNDSYITDFTFMPSSALSSSNYTPPLPMYNTTNLVVNGRFENTWGEPFGQQVGDLTEICSWTALQDNLIGCFQTNQTLVHFVQLSSISQTVATYANSQHVLTFQSQLNTSIPGCGSPPIFITLSILPSSFGSANFEVQSQTGWETHIVRFFTNASSVNLTFTSLPSNSTATCSPYLTDVQMVLQPTKIDFSSNEGENRQFGGRDRLSRREVGLIFSTASSWLILLMVGVVALFFGARYRGKHVQVTEIIKPLCRSFNETDTIRRARQFDLRHISHITNGFSSARCIGQGGFAKVYKGAVSCDGSMGMAVKRAHNFQPFEQFHAEVDMLDRVHHRRLVQFLGYCEANGTEQILVFELMKNGSLYAALHDPSQLGTPLTTDQRFRIAKDVAHGLEYLHHGAKPSIIHRDIKSANVLLSESFSAKLADFGLFKLGREDADTKISNLSVATHVKGSYGYMDPQTCSTGTISTKSDVYSFGVLLLELISGRKAIHEGTLLSDWANRLFAKDQDWLLHMVDPSLICNYRNNNNDNENSNDDNNNNNNNNNRELSSSETTQLRLMSMVARECLHDQRDRRPNMMEVVKMLGGQWRSDD